jgi:hypothetical protein
MFKKIVIIILSIFAVLLLCLLGVLWYGASWALNAEHSLQATMVTFELANDYVASHNGKWPESWQSLEKLPSYRPFHHLQEMVIIDFDADLKVLAEQSAEQFTAIRPQGDCFPYKHRYQVEKLLATIKEYAYCDCPCHCSRPLLYQDKPVKKEDDIKSDY